MPKTFLGIDIGSDRIKMALVKNGQVKKVAVEAVPENVVKEGQVVSVDTMADVIKATMKQNSLKASDACIVLSSDNIFTRNVTMPIMSHDQLLYNLPFEFKDYITNDLKDYIFDYAMISTTKELEDALARKEADAKKEESEDEGNTQEVYGMDSGYDDSGYSMELTAVVAPKELIADMQLLCRKAGLRLAKAAPPVSSFAAIIRHYENANNLEGPGDEYCILDMGYRNIRMYMYKDDSHNVTKILDIGLSSVDSTIADMFNVDIHLAHTYLLTNHDGCLNSEVCVNAFNNIAVELMRALRFYKFSNPESTLEDIWVCGGGSTIEPLRAAISEMLEMKIHPAIDLLADMNINPEYNNFMLAIGMALE